MGRRYLLLLMTVLLLALPAVGLSQEAYIEIRECMLSESGVIYYVWACAGPDTVNDFELCLFDQAGNELEFVSISAPPCWYPHASGNCGYWYTEENVILPGECLNEFDFKVPLGNCIVLVRWRFTFNGIPVTDWVDTWLTCWITETERETWGAIKSIYR
jgi:hypothetical protein